MHNINGLGFKTKKQNGGIHILVLYKYFILYYFSDSEFWGSKKKNKISHFSHWAELMCNKHTQNESIKIWSVNLFEYSFWMDVYSGALKSYNPKRGWEG